MPKTQIECPYCDREFKLCQHHEGMALPVLAPLNRPVTLWDVGWALFHYWEMKMQTGLPEYPTDDQIAATTPRHWFTPLADPEEQARLTAWIAKSNVEMRALADAFPGVTTDQAWAALKALGFGLCRDRHYFKPCLDRDECCPLADGVDDAKAHAALHARQVLERCRPVIDTDEQAR